MVSYTTERLRAENHDFNSFYLDSSEDDETIDQFVEYIDQWPSDLKTWSYMRFREAWNRWV